MTRKILIKSAAVCIAIVLFALALSGCGLIDKLKYLLTPEPTLPSSASGSRVALSDRVHTETDYGYNSLDSVGLKTTYDVIGDYMNRSYGEEFDIGSMSLSDFDKALCAYETDHPEEFWLDLDSRYSYIDYGDTTGIELHFEMTGEELQSAKEIFDQKVEEIAANAPAEADDYHIEIFINDYLIDHCDYISDASMCHNAYGALVKGGAVCDGYSRAFQVLCNRLGVDCVGINGYCPEFNKENGESSDTGHMWNCVKIGGSWYHIDVTWNDGDQHIQRYLYFNMNTADIEKTHTISPLFSDDSDSEKLYNVFIPECTSEEYNYMKREYITLYDLDNDSELLAAFLQVVRSGGRYFDFLISDNLDYGETTQAISDSYGYRWIEAVNSYNSGGAQVSSDSNFYTYTNVNAVTFDIQYIN